MEKESEVESIELVLIGKSFSGKTSLINNLIKEQQNSAFPSFLIEINEKQYCIQMKDISGYENFRPFIPMYSRQADGVFVLFDLTSRESFLEAESWFTDFRDNAPPNAVAFLVGNKLDLENERRVLTQEVLDFASKYNMEYIEISAKTGQNVNELFHKFATKVINEKEKHQNENKKKEENIDLFSQPEKKNEYCNIF